MLASLLLILPVFLIIALGVLVDILHILPKQTGSIIGAYVLYLALPILMLHILAGSTLGDILHGGFWAGMICSQVAIYVLGYLWEMFFGEKKHGSSAAYALACSCSNVAFIGLPVILSLMPGNKEALVAAGLAVITPNVVTIPCQVQLEYMKFSNGQASGIWKKLTKAVILNPLMLGTVIGFLLGATGIGLWGPLDEVSKMVGGTTAPCMLLALGLDLRSKVRIAFSGDKKFKISRLATAIFLKLILSPILTWAFFYMMGVTGTWMAVGIIMMGSATALVSYVIAEIYGHLPEEIALIAVVTNVLNLVTLTITTAILQAYGLL